MLDTAYVGKSFFANDTLFHPELPAGQFGVAGEPVPYSVGSDDIITSLLLGCMLIAVIAYSKSHHFMLRQTKEFFKIADRDRNTVATETGNEVWLQLLLILQTCVLGGVLWLWACYEFVGRTFTVEPWQMVIVFSLVLATYFFIKTILYSIVNWVFFSWSQNTRWLKSFLFLAAVEGVLLLPVVLLVAYFDISVKNAMLGVAIIVIFIKILLFYKSHTIFFKENVFVIQSFLYLCTIEIVPLGLLYAILRIVSGFLRINY